MTTQAAALSTRIGATRSARKSATVKSVTVLHSTRAGKSSPVDVDPLLVKIAVVTDALGSQAKTAEFLDVARSQPGKWLAGHERPNPRARRLIQDLEYIWDRITDDRSRSAAHIWLGSANAFLDGATPLTWLKTRGPDDVIAAIDAEEAGSYA
ncbi:MAG: antitoxin Xre/MbcA/ParS toxin-binding domain-containing protein [Acidimicrobiales bacterium]